MLARWVVRSPSDRLLDPACGDGRFLAAHSNVVGVGRDASALVAVAKDVPHATVYAADFSIGQPLWRDASIALPGTRLSFVISNSMAPCAT